MRIFRILNRFFNQISGFFRIFEKSMRIFRILNRFSDQISGFFRIFRFFRDQWGFSLINFRIFQDFRDQWGFSWFSNGFFDKIFTIFWDKWGIRDCNVAAFVLISCHHNWHCSFSAGFFVVDIWIIFGWIFFSKIYRIF